MHRVTRPYFTLSFFLALSSSLVRSALRSSFYDNCFHRDNRERMGNLKRFGGPLSTDWHFKEETLQKKIVQRMVEYGMIPVLPGFSGHVPSAIRKLFPEAHIGKVSCWVGFSSKYSCLDFVDPADPLFQTIGDKYMEEMNKTYGSYGLYSADPFNEMSPSSYEPDYITSVGRGIYNGMSNFDSSAIWVMQAWFLLGGEAHWMNTTGGRTAPAEVLFKAVPPGKLLLLDLYSEGWPFFDKASFYYGQPYIWNVLHNFGGKMEMFGGLQNVDDGVTGFMAHPSNETFNTRMGFGLTMEGIYQNYPQYQFAIDRYWSKDWIDPQQWIEDYAMQRYGQTMVRLQFAWKILVASIYSRPFGPQFLGNFDERSAETMQLLSLQRDVYNPFSKMFERPGFTNNYKVWYDRRMICNAWNYFIQEAAHSPSLSDRDLFRYDLTDLTRQVLLQIGTEIYITDLLAGYRNKSVETVRQSGVKLMQVFDDMELMLKSDRRFLLGRWVDAARQKGNTSDIWQSTLLARQYEYNLRNQVTMWGPRGEILDYARKQWAGLIVPYYKARWQLFSELMAKALDTGTRFDDKVWNALVRYQVELPFTEAFDNSPNKTTGDAIEIATRMHAKYINLC